MQQLHRCLLTGDKVASEVRSQSHSSRAKAYTVMLGPNRRFPAISRDAANDGLGLLHSVCGFKDRMRSIAIVAGPQRADQQPKPLAQHRSL
ncbi:hypothetical protein COO60DRAFT_1645266 [Scenedesmus sp. NREL 46B-D3]|nr:hypothetical protein COO60DRAFT_1645266 [Scenedesmus sp. NREL 46B-D3]